MAKKEFKTESKKLLDMMINSIYTHKEIFLRELISNASDAIDKLYFRSLTDDSVKLVRGDYEIRLTADEEASTLTISDNGCGMTVDELENNLGTIAKSGSLDFKNTNKSEESSDDDVDIIGQFGVGFYSAFMVSDKIEVETKVYGSDEAWKWTSEGVDGYEIEPCDKEEAGTVITLYIKKDTDDENYSSYLREYKLRELVKKYSDYIRYPIKMMVEKSVPKEGSDSEFEKVKEDETLNNMVPLWKREKSEVSDDDYAHFYMEKYMDFEKPLKVIRQKTDGIIEYTALLFIPSHAPFDYYSKGYEKGLQLYASGVMIMDRCSDLLPDYFSFVKGLVDSADLSLNISREMLQQDRQLKRIAKAIEKKVASELGKMLENERDDYEKFFTAFGTQLKWGLYNDFGSHKQVLQDLVIFKSSFESRKVTLKEYVSRMKEDQTKIYYAVGDTADKIAMLPQVEAATSRGFEVLYAAENVDEFAFQMMRDYDGKEFVNICSENPDITTDEEKESLKAENANAADLLTFMKESIGADVTDVRFTNTLQKHPVCLSTEGDLSFGMEKLLNKMPGAEENTIRAEAVLEINMNHPIAAKLNELFESDKDKLAQCSKILFAQARLISGLSIDNPVEISEMICGLML